MNIESLIGKKIRYWNGYNEKNLMIYTDAVILGGYLAVESEITQPYLFVCIVQETFHSDNPTKNAGSISTVRMNSTYIKFG